MNDAGGELAELLAQLAERHVKLTLEDGKLCVLAPRDSLTSELKSKLTAWKEELTQVLLERRNGPRPEAASIVPDPSSWNAPFPLTPMQEAYWVSRLGGVGGDRVSVHLYVEVDGTGVDVDRLVSSWQRVVERHAMLRASIGADNTQRVSPEPRPCNVTIDDLRGRSEDEVRLALDSTRARMSHQVHRLDLGSNYEVHVSRMDEGRTRLHWSLDLHCVDGASVSIVARDWQRFYLDRGASLPALDLSFRDCVIAEREARSSDAYQQSLAFWQNRLAAIAPPPALPTLPDGRPALAHHEQFGHLERRIPSSSWQELKSRAAAHDLTPSAMLLSAFADVLAAWCEDPRFTLNLTLFNRQAAHPQVDDVVGDFTSTLLLSVDTRAGRSFVDRARIVQRDLWTLLGHRIVSGVHVVREYVRARGVAPAAPMPVVFTSFLGLAADHYPSVLQSLRTFGDIVYRCSQTPSVWLDFQVFEDAGDLVISWDYSRAHYHDELAREIFGVYEAFLARLAGDPASWVGAVPRLLPAGQSARHARANATADVRPPPDEFLHAGFERQATAHPERVAVVTTTRTLSYGELRARALELAHQLIARGARPDALVAVVMERGWEQVVAVLAILYAGAAYLPVDPALPAARIARIVERSGATIALTQPWLESRLAWPPALDRIAVQAAPPDGDRSVSVPATKATPGDLAYVIFTSGSTGEPKGVMIEHRAAVNTVVDINERHRITADDRVLAVSSLSFDLSVWDIFGLLGAGGAVVVPDAESDRDPAHWATLLAAHRVTVWNSVPALLGMLVEHAGTVGAEPLGTLRVALLSGDWIPVTLPDRVRALQPSIAVVSMGGATEVSIWSIIYPVDRVDPSWQSIPYGYALTNQTVEVLDASFEPRPDGVVGMLYIGGVGLARGYWGDEAETAAKFVIDPHTGRRLYRTGDLGRWKSDGVIEFLGRADFQVKVRGHRIELGEIEATLREHPEVRDAVAVVRTGRTGVQQLVAYVVPTASPPPAADALEAFVRARLPEYMVPVGYVPIAAIPLSSNGKVDRKALPEPNEELDAGSQDDVSPRTPEEAELARIWCEVLGREHVGVHAPFVALGGDSVLGARVVTRARRAGLRITVQQIYERQTIAALAEICSLKNATKP